MDFVYDIILIEKNNEGQRPLYKYGDNMADKIQYYKTFTNRTLEEGEVPSSLLKGEIALSKEGDIVYYGLGSNIEPIKLRPNENIEEKIEKIKYYGDPDIVITDESYFEVSEDDPQCIIACTCQDETVVFPYKINGVEIKYIGNSSASGVMQSSTPNGFNIILPNTITDILEGGFRSNFLHKIKLSDNLLTIENFAFYECNHLEDMVIPDNVSSIGEEAFYWCGFETVKFPRGLKHLGNHAFLAASMMTSIDLSNCNMLDGIPTGCFENCSSLRKVTLPSSDMFSFIRTYAFAGNVELLEINIPSNVTHLERHIFYSSPDMREASTTKVYLPYTAGSSSIDAPFGEWDPNSLTNGKDDLKKVICVIHKDSPVDLWIKENDIPWVCEYSNNVEYSPMVNLKASYKWEEIGGRLPLDYNTWDFTYEKPFGCMKNGECIIVPYNYTNPIYDSFGKECAYLWDACNRIYIKEFVANEYVTLSGVNDLFCVIDQKKLTNSSFIEFNGTMSIDNSDGSFESKEATLTNLHKYINKYDSDYWDEVYGVYGALELSWSEFIRVVKIEGVNLNTIENAQGLLGCYFEPKWDDYTGFCGLKFTLDFQLDDIVMFKDGLWIKVGSLNYGELEQTVKNLARYYGAPMDNGISDASLGEYIGQQYFDIGLGVPVWWNGQSWVDALGEVRGTPSTN